jgi:hypothetical protein
MDRADSHRSGPRPDGTRSAASAGGSASPGRAARRPGTQDGNVRQSGNRPDDGNGHGNRNPDSPHLLAHARRPVQGRGRADGTVTAPLPALINLIVQAGTLPAGRFISTGRRVYNLRRTAVSAPRPGKARPGPRAASSADRLSRSARMSSRPRPGLMRAGARRW